MTTPTSMMSKGEKEWYDAKQSVLIEEHHRMPLDHHNLSTAENSCPLCLRSTPPAKEEWEMEVIPKIRYTVVRHIKFYRKNFNDSEYAVQEILDLFRSLRSQAYKEGRREAIEEIEKQLHEEPVVLVDIRMDSNIPHKYKHAILYERVKKIVDALKGKEKV